MTAWTITTNSTASGLPFVNGDSIANVTTAAKFTWDIVNADYGIIAHGMTCGYGIIQYNPGTNVKIKTATAITINEGGRLLSLGTAASRVTIMGEDKTNANHYIYANSGGKLYFDYTDISLFIDVRVTNMAHVSLLNSTITSTGYPIRCFNGAANLLIVNSTLNQDTASRYILIMAYGGITTAINSAFVSTTNNYLASGATAAQFNFAGCTYQGNPIASDDITDTACDYDLRIYEASAVTETGGLSGVTDGISHPSMDTMGMLYDSTNYMKVSAFLSPPVTASGAATVYVLQKTAYWPSGLAVGSRTWKFWSDSSQAETGDNQQYTHVLSKLNYVTSSVNAWAGNPVSATLSKIQAIPTPSNNPPLSVFSDAPCTTKTSTLTIGDTGYVNGGINLQSIPSTETRTATTLIQIRKVSDDSVKATLYNAADTLDGDTDYSYKDDTEFGGGTAYNFSTTGYAAGEYYVMVTTSGTDITTKLDVEYFNVLAVVVPKAVFSTDYYLYSVDNATGAIPTPTYIQGETLRLAGQVTLTGADTVDNDTDILLYKADGTLVETIPTSQFSSSDGVTQDLDTILGSIFTKDTDLLTPGDYYYLMNISGANIEEALQIIATFSVVTTGAAPFISDVSMTQSTINQRESTTLRFKATNMTSTDFAYLEFVGKGIVKRFTTTDNLNYVLVVYGADLPVMSSNLLRISAINSGGSDTDATLYLAVTAVASAIPAYSLRNAITIPDDIGLIIKALKTNSINHRLKHIVPLDNIVKEPITDWKNVPGIYIRKVSNLSLVTQESLGEDYDTGVEAFCNVWECEVLFDIVCHVKTIFNYPPIETDGENSANRYEHAKNCLPVIHTLLHTFFSENRTFVDPDGSTLAWDTVDAGQYQLIDGGYNGARDVWAIQCLYKFQFEMEVR